MFEFHAFCIPVAYVQASQLVCHLAVFFIVSEVSRVWGLGGAFSQNW